MIYKEQIRIVSYLIIIACFTLLLASSAEPYTQSISHIPKLYKGNAFLLVTDLSGMGPSVAIKFHDDYGREVSSINKLLRPKGKLQIAVDDHLKASGCIAVESSSDLVLAEYVLLNRDQTISIIPLQSVSGNERYFINCFRMPFCQESYITLSDPKGNGPMVQMEFYAKTGELTKIIRKMLRPYGILILKVSDHIDKDIQGKVSVRSFSGGISVYGVNICNKKPVFALPSNISGRELLIAGSTVASEATNDLVFADVSAKGTNVKVSMLDEYGNLVSEAQKSLLPNGTIAMNLMDELGKLGDGTLKIKGASEILADYWERNIKTGDCFFSNAIINPALDKPRFAGNLMSVSYFVPNENIEFVLSILNIGRKPIIAELEFYSLDGEKIGSSKISLQPDKSIKESVNRFFAKSHLGTIIVKDANSSLVITSSIQDINNGRLLGKTYAISR